MRAVTWQGTRDVGVEEVPDPRSSGQLTRFIKVTTSGLCDSDLHLYEMLATSEKFEEFQPDPELVITVLGERDVDSADR